MMGIKSIVYWLYFFLFAISLDRTIYVIKFNDLENDINDYSTWKKILSD